MNFIWITIDRVFRKKLSKYLDLIVTYSDDAEIFKVKAVQIENGADLSALKAKRSENLTLPYNVITVSSMRFWHGYERLITGLYEYIKDGEKKGPVILHMVGDGPKKTEWENLVKQLNIEKNVIFYGVKTGKDLDEIYSKCHFAVSTLNMEGKGVKISSELKNRDYVVKGIPFGYACEDRVLNNENDFCLKLPYSYNEKIDIAKICNFIDNFYKTNSELKMFNFAKENLSWEKQFEKVFSCFK